jgi:hypothetical protein
MAGAAFRMRGRMGNPSPLYNRKMAGKLDKDFNFFPIFPTRPFWLVG